jgi:uncharacterized delta-60 repeat protein
MKTKLLIILVMVLWSLPLLAQEVDTAWVRTYNGPADSIDYARAIVVDGSGNVYVTGYSYGVGTENDYATIKYYPNGDTAWIRRYDGPTNKWDMANAMAIDQWNNVYVTGYSYDNITYYDFATIKYYPTGDTAWVRRYNGPGMYSDVANAITVDAYDKVFVTGYTLISGANYDGVTIKYHANGDTAWVRIYGGPANERDQFNAIATDNLGNVYVTGWSWTSSTNGDYLTIKYYPDGDTAWVRTYNGPGDSLDYANAIAVDGSGNVYVTGYSYGVGTSNDYATIKYSQNGDELWVRRYNGPGDSIDVARSIALDGSGNIYVTGTSFGSGTSGDATTIKYYPNGHTAWVRRYNGPADSLDGASSIAVDASGNVYVTGYSWVSGTDRDYLTISYYPNGDIAWLKTYNGPVDSIDVAQAIAVDGSGNVYVTGISWGSETYWDYATIKYVRLPQEICNAFLSPKSLNVGKNGEHSFKIHLHPCEPMNVSQGDSAEVYVDVDADNAFDSDERYPAWVVSNGMALIVNVVCPDLVDNDPKVGIFSINDIPILDSSGDDIILSLDTFTPKGKGPKVLATVLPDQFNLSQNYPNPFNPTCEIEYALPTDCRVTLSIYNMLGQKVRVLVDEYQEAGYKSVKWDGKDDQGQEVTSGVYFYRLDAGNFTQSRKMILMK